MIPVAFRFDDPSPSSNAMLERQIIAAFVAHQCTATFAVTPFSRINGELVGLTKQRAQHLRDGANREAIEIALHGFSHERRGQTPSGKPSEFADLPAIEQRELIERGLAHLVAVFGRNISGFVPPWNSFDAITLSVLETLGIDYISGGWEVPDQYRGFVSVVPRTCNLGRLQLAVKEARLVRLFEPVVVVVMHHHDFREEGDGTAITDLSEFHKLLAWLIRQPDLAIMPLCKIATRVSASAFYRGIKRYRRKYALPWRVQRYVPQNCLLTAPLWRLLVPLFPPALRAETDRREH